MQEHPAELIVALPDAELQRIATLWDERLVTSFFAPQADAAGRVDLNTHVSKK